MFLIDSHIMEKILWKSTGTINCLVTTFFKISFMFRRWTKLIQDWNILRLSKLSFLAELSLYIQYTLDHWNTSLKSSLRSSSILITIMDLYFLLELRINDNKTDSVVYLLIGCHGSVGVLVCGIATQGFVVIPSAGLLAEATRLSIRVDSSKPFVALARIQLLEKWEEHVYW